MNNSAILNFEVIARRLWVETEIYRTLEANDAAIFDSKTIEFCEQLHDNDVIHLSSTHVRPFEPVLDLA